MHEHLTYDGVHTNVHGLEKAISGVSKHQRQYLLYYHLAEAKMTCVIKKQSGQGVLLKDRTGRKTPSIQR